MILSAALVLAGCDEQRDLYVAAGPLIWAEGDWGPSLDQSDMTMKATAIAYDESRLVAKEYFFAPRTVMLPVDNGIYDVLLFNGLMYSEKDTHLDDVYFRGTNRLDTFEAVAAEGAQIKRLGTRADDEYIASNEMEIITSAVERQEIEASRSYYIKYKNGKNGFDTPKDYIAAELNMTPVAMSYEAQIKVTIENISSAAGANAALYGFVGSAFISSRMPSHFYVTHHFNLNSKKIVDSAKDIGTIESPVFVTFGPPLDAPDNKYEVYVKILLVDNTEYENTFDVTTQLDTIIEAIKANQAGGGAPQYRLEIPVAINIKLPIVEPVGGGVGLGDWEDDELIHVPIT